MGTVLCDGINIFFQYPICNVYIFQGLRYEGIVYSISFMLHPAFHFDKRQKFDSGWREMIWIIPDFIVHGRSDLSIIGQIQ